MKTGRITLEMSVEQLIEHLQQYPNKKDNVRMLTPGYETLTVGVERVEPWECKDATFLCLISDHAPIGTDPDELIDYLLLNGR